MASGKKDDMLAQTLPQHRSPGRPMKLGRFVTGQELPGGIGVYVGRCGSCNDKVVIPRKDAEVIAAMFHQEENNIIVRFTRWFWHRRS